MSRMHRTNPNITPIGVDKFTQSYLDAGMIPNAERVWRNGQDITDTVPPEQWPWPYSMYYGQGWRPIVALDGTRMP